MFCINCTSKLAEDAKFCGKCGKAVTAHSEKSDEGAVTYAPSEMLPKTEEDEAIDFISDKFEVLVKTERGLAFVEELATEIKGFGYGWVLGIVSIITSFTFVSQADIRVSLMGVIPPLLYWVYVFFKSARKAAQASWKARIPLDDIDLSIGRSAFSHIVMTVVAVAIPVIYVSIDLLLVSLKWIYNVITR